MFSYYFPIPKNYYFLSDKNSIYILLINYVIIQIFSFSKNDKNTLKDKVIKF